MSTLTGVVVAWSKPVYSYDWLCEKMKDRSLVELRLHDGSTVRGVINGIRPESGSGNHWLVKVYHRLITKGVYVRTA